MKNRYLVILTTICSLFAFNGCRSDSSEVSISEGPEVPRGYQERLEFQIDDQVFQFGPFVGYYFKPVNVPDTSRLYFLCFNEKSFYTKDVREDELLYKGTAILQILDENVQPIPETDSRIVPVFFSDAPYQWLKSRPEPQQRFVHFHSAYNTHGAVYAGYWLAHEAVEKFTYDMGGRVDQDSPLYHTVQPGIDLNFARIIEFDHGR